LRDSFAARSSRRERRSRRSSRRRSAARSRFDPRESLREEASARPRLPDCFEGLAAAFLDALDAARAEAGAVMKKIAEMMKAVRPRERNFGVIELFLA
jgi:hypothetical protein